MITTSIPAMVILDLTVIAVIVLAIVVAVSNGMFQASLAPRIGRLLLFTGMAVAGLSCLVDLLFLTSAVTGFSAPLADGPVSALQHDVRWVGMLLALAAFAAGLVIVAIQRREILEKVSRTQIAVEDARDSAARYEGSFNSVLRQSTDPIYCFEFIPPIPVDLPVEEQVARSFDAVLVECNAAFAKSIGKDSREQARGMRLREMRNIMSPEAHSLFHWQFVENGYWLADHEYSFRDPQGNEKLFLINVTGDIENGALVRLWGTEKSILEQSEMTKTLGGRLKFQEFLTSVSSRLLIAQADDVESVLNRCLREICEFLEADRATIVWLRQETQTADLLYFFNETGDKPWDQVPMENFPAVTSGLLHGEPVVVNSVEEYSKDHEVDGKHLEEIGLKAMAAVPLVVAGEIFGVVTLGNIHSEREWTHYTLADLQTLADLMANVVFRINSHKALSQAMLELQSMKDRLEAENIYLREEISQNVGFDELIGQSDRLRFCLHQVQQVAATDTAVLVQGETGTGKELIVRAIHEKSDRCNRPLVKVNCAALPADLIENELFGHEKGAFTGASSQKRGRFDLADGGTLFLDEIGDFPLELQGKLLRVLQEGEFQRVGGTETIRVDVRLIAATNRELQIAVDCGQFRADLYYRISVYPINLPPLREREGDIPLLTEHFVHKHSANLGKHVEAISASMMEQLRSYAWPGNVRELESVVQRALISGTGPVLQLSETLGQRSSPQGSTVTDIEHFDLLAAEKSHIEKVLNQAGWVVAGGAGAAVKLGVPPSTLRSKMKKLGIRRPS